MKIYRKCPICEGNNLKEIKHINVEMNEILPNFYHIVYCKDCGLVYNNTKASESDYEEYYTSYNKYNNSNIIKLENKFIYKTLLDIILSYSKKNDKILDIGCGAGDVLFLLRKNGFMDLTGLDPSASSIENLKTKGLNGIIGSINNLPFSDTKFDIIILQGVLEHLFNPKEAVLNLKKILKPSGKIICGVPDASKYHLTKIPFPYFFNIEHINHFDRFSLSLLLSKTGCNIIENKEISIKLVDKNVGVLFSVFGLHKFKESFESVNNYLSQTDKIENKQKKIINDLVKTGEEIVIWGSGNYARDIMTNTNLLKANIKSIIDNNSDNHSKSFFNINISPPDYLMNFKGKIIILSLLYSKIISKQIKDMKFKNKIIEL